MCITRLEVKERARAAVESDNDSGYDADLDVEPVAKKSKRQK
jgi:hypothetical protein